jgi:uncharacterized protein YbcI
MRDGYPTGGEEMRSRDGSAFALPDAPSERGQRMLELSNAVVRIHKQLAGKGPTKARSHLMQDLVVVVLEGGFTRSEQTLHEAGHDRELLQARLAMQAAAETQLRSAVEEVIGRRVRSFMSANDPENGFQTEIFVLEPVGKDGDELTSRAERARDRHHDLLDEHRALRAEQTQSREALRREREDVRD